MNSKDKMFTQYLSDFWLIRYENQDNYRRLRIIYHKNNAYNSILFDVEFYPGINDIALAVQDLHFKPNQLIRALQKLYLEN